MQGSERNQNPDDNSIYEYYSGVFNNDYLSK